MTIRQTYQEALARLKNLPDAQDSCAFDLSCLLEHCFGADRFHLSDDTAEMEQRTLFDSLCDRYAAGEPLQYLLGEWEFYGLPFAVGEGVLIPRPDTETLVETALDLLEGVQAPYIADLCAGSGAIGVTLAHLLPAAQVFAVELSNDAFPYLERNIARNLPQGGSLIDSHPGPAFFPRVVAIHADVLRPLSLPSLPPLDLIVSNPPYIPREDLPHLQLQVRQEPMMALDGGGDGLDFYRALPPLYLPFLKSGGSLAFEVGFDQSEAVMGLLQTSGYVDVCSRRDLAGIERVVCGRRPL